MLKFVSKIFLFEDVIRVVLLISLRYFWLPAKQLKISGKVLRYFLIRTK